MGSYGGTVAAIDLLLLYWLILPQNFVTVTSFDRSENWVRSIIYHFDTIWQIFGEYQLIRDPTVIDLKCMESTLETIKNIERSLTEVE